MKKIPAMTSDKVHQYLTELGIQWQGKGVAVELGCWLGASSAALLKGLKEVGYNKSFWAFDRWVANKEQVQKAKAQGVELKVGQNTKLIYDYNLFKIYDHIISIKGSLPQTLNSFEIVNKGGNESIEFCLFDAPKQEPIFTGCMKKLLPHFIPGVTVLGLLDYKFYERHEGRKRKRFKAPVDFIHKYRDYFETIKQWDDECPVFFRYIKKLEL